MNGETDLGRMLASLSPVLTDGEFVFCSFADAHYGDHADLEPIAAIDEPEGLTLVVPKPVADAQALDYATVFRMISLGVHSSLEAAGLTAAFSNRLAEHGISANVIAGYYHDHIFVPRDQAKQAVDALAEPQR